MIRKIGSVVLLLLWLAIILLPGYFGWDYYTSKPHDRVFTEIHGLLKPTGIIGHGYGIIGTVFMVIGVATYMMRKRLSFMQNWGKLKSWLHFHIFLCTTGPAQVIWHTTFKFHGLVSISFWSMVIVVASGVFGRYVYNRIPKTEDGFFQNIEFILKEKLTLKNRISEHLELSTETVNVLGLHDAPDKFNTPWAALFNALKYDLTGLFRRQRDRKYLESLDMDDEICQTLISAVKDYRWRNRQQFLIEPMQKLFGYWHVFHIPLAIIMFIILAVHVGVAITFGYTWIF